MDSQFSTNENNEETPLIRCVTEGRRSRLSICLVIGLVFIQSLGLMGIDDLLRHDNNKFFAIHSRSQGPWLFTFAVIIYLLPLAFAIFTDTIAGRYLALCIGIGLKTAGSLIGFIAILLFESTVNLNQTEKNCLVGAYGLQVVLIMTGLAIVCFTLASFTADQVKRTPADVSSAFRWFMWAIALISVLYTVYWSCQPAGLGDRSFYSTIRHAIIAGTDVVSIVLIKGGKSCFVIAAPGQGKASRNEMITIVKVHIFRSKPPDDPHADGIWDPTERMGYIRQRRMLERLKLKRGIYFFLLLSSMSFPLSITLVFNQVFIIANYNWQPDWMPVRSYMIILAVPLMELTIRRCGRHLWQNTINNLQNTLAVGAMLTVVALVLTGALDMYPWANGGKGVSGYMTIPPFIVIDVATVLIFPAESTFCYLESPRGLETVAIALGVCLSILLLAIEAACGWAIDIKKFPRYDFLCYILAALDVAFFLLAFLPSIIWYRRATTAIDAFLINEHGSNRVGQRSA